MRPLRAALIGIVAVGTTLATAEFLARMAAWIGLAGTSAAPFDALGAAFIAVTPEWLKDLGIGLFGQHDKVALAVAMAVTFLLAGAIIGWIGRVHLGAALAVAAGLVAIAGVAIVTRPGVGPAELVPLVIGSGGGLALLYAAFHPRYEETPGRGAASDGAAGPSRRRALRLVAGGTLAASAAGVLSRLIPAPVDVQAERASVTLPPTLPPTAPDTTEQGGTAPPYGATTTPRPAQIVIPPAKPYGADPDVAELTPFVTDADVFYRVDTAFVPPRVATDTWQLTVHGLVRHPFQVTWAELLAMPQIARWVTLACVSNEVGGNLVGNAAWQGVRVADLLARAEPLPGADCLYSTSADDFTVTTPLDVLTDGRDALVAIGMNGAPLPVEHGFPARLVVPGLYGYVSATKWVVDLEVTTFAQATAYWTERGWAARGPVKTSSRIDTPHYGVSVKPGVVPVAGVAWAQHRGISGVQVRVDDGPWMDAMLSPSASADTWVQWVYRWDTAGVPPGSHRLTCRAIDGTGAVQIATPSSVAPDGATGYHSVNVVTG